MTPTDIGTIQITRSILIPDAVNDFPFGSDVAQEFSGLSASWLEAVVGLKAELFANIYLGASVRIGFLVSNKEPDNFRNLWIPGFNKVTDGSKFGVGYNYSMTYFLPLYKKAKKIKEKEEKRKPTGTELNLKFPKPLTKIHFIISFVA